MTIEQRETVSDWYGKLKEFVVMAGGAIAIIAAIWATTIWFTGGLKPQSQVAQDALSKQLDSIQATQEKQATSSQVAQDRILARLDALPRPSDYLEQTNHLSRLDARADALGDRIGRAEIATGELTGRIQSLIAGSAAPTRNPR